MNEKFNKIDKENLPSGILCKISGDDCDFVKTQNGFFRVKNDLIIDNPELIFLVSNLGLQQIGLEKENQEQILLILYKNKLLYISPTFMEFYHV